MSNEKLDNDIVLAKFINYMKKALIHKKLNYIRDTKKIIKTECSINGLESKLQNTTDIEIDLRFFDFLNEKEQKVINLHIIEKLTYKEISKILNLKPESIRKIQYRAIKKLESRCNND